MLPPETSTDLCRHDRAPLKRIGTVKRGDKVRYMLLCTECGFAVSTEELRRLRAAGAQTRRRPPEYCGFGWAARRAGEAEGSETTEAK